ncbi:hypothetical protein HS088_TW10G00064 [Tripterygium wilfordii]|uniref:F-box associated beta-propeller type 1 domain-containing protein n=1 Tax=Tripterygium wilfordii TaxID=458696 RepID=A0A7J7D479_TRIWF|nr:F-box protein CPR1-like [Tripterygium wilfordii]XP_038713169.1 F-box protein CPR1-like [Tripterygium wilfordii]KAF5741069.1 hypothetical protein HS088_TW10G00064 [Tripterygium wilfordii]
MYSASLDEGLDRPLTPLRNPLKSGKHGAQLLSCCNGLIWLGNSQHDLALWNPFTRSYKRIPAESVEKSNGLSDICHYSYGFGQESTRNDYTVVSITQFGRDIHGPPVTYEVKLYSLRSNCWRTVQGFPYLGYFVSRVGCFANDALHWLLTKYSSSGKDVKLVAFNLGKEEFQELTLPMYTESFDPSFLVVLQGCLCVLAKDSGCKLTIYAMKQYGARESWTKLCTIGNGDVPGVLECVWPLMYSKKGDKLLLVENLQDLIWL